MMADLDIGAHILDDEHGYTAHYLEVLEVEDPDAAKQYRDAGIIKIYPKAPVTPVDNAAAGGGGAGGGAGGSWLFPNVSNWLPALMDGASKLLTAGTEIAAANQQSDPSAAGADSGN